MFSQVVFCILRSNSKIMSKQSHKSDENQAITAHPEVEWPVIKEPIVISEEVKSWQMPRQFTPEEIAADERLAYLLSK